MPAGQSTQNGIASPDMPTCSLESLPQPCSPRGRGTEGACRAIINPHGSIHTYVCTYIHTHTLHAHMYILHTNSRIETASRVHCTYVWIGPWLACTTPHTTSSSSSSSTYMLFHNHIYHCQWQLCP
ncbi:hypothetical protein COCSADRAFT_316022 [Bipolaris sorokiniana ND90Pr]|uniref:Uncharacterized protein n=1 Tax=Cochliobolus sativus (strain ND90Pr / ATCC 201652) TaxID=665912 RepID=M2SRK3_COCSN|nr:uncharacterized protein COCSADRAFT_316022 [Bipolaris sorokiniana ND90Pr]EMD64915.1 hypothetical protein COCSADRAFT_316022 [Bipolaris sorokiniana ND90Pr]